MYAYAAIAIGDILIGFVSQYFKSRKKALYLFYFFTIFQVFFFSAEWINRYHNVYGLCSYWVSVQASGPFLLRWAPSNLVPI